jgi:hypothetical protein
MKFIEIIFENSGLKQGKLYQAAQKAYVKPDTGITINHQGAYNVIKDCAMITLRYLPHFIFGSYTHPFASLKGKFKKPDIEEFVKKCRDDYALNQLLIVIKEKYESQNPKSVKVTVANNLLNTSFNEMDDPYGLYGVEEVDDVKNTNDDLNDVDLLCMAFSVE